MTEQKETGPKPRITPPPYVEFEAKEREQFLSELGNFSPPQRELFHTLCKTWQPEIPYNRLLTQVAGSTKNVAFEIDRLMERLSEKRCGLLVLRYDEKETVKDKIILTAQGDSRYFYFRLRNELGSFFANPQEPLPLESGLSAKGLRIPPECMRNVSDDDFSRIFSDQTGEDFLLYRVPLAEGEALFIPTGEGVRFINACLARLREYFSNTNLLAEMARIKETSLADMKRRVDSKDPIFWLDLGKSILTLKNDPLFQKKVQTDANMFRFADVLSRFIEKHLSELQKRKIENEERERDLEALNLQIEKEKGGLVTQERFTELFGTIKEKYGTESDAVRKEFFEKYLEVKEKTRIPVIVQIAKQYIHRNNFYDYFIGSLFACREILYEQYFKEMEYLIKTNNRDKKTVFFSRENFETDIIDRLKEDDPFLSEVIQKPRLLAEIVIHTLKEKRRVKNMNDIKEELEKYFKPDSMEYKSLPLIFGLSVLDIFQRAFSHLPFWRQIWLKITGKYKSYQNQYFGLGGRPASMSGKGANRSGKQGAGESQGPAAQQDSRSQDGTQPRRRRPIEIKKKAYTKKQQESAWQEFSKTLKPK